MLETRHSTVREARTPQNLPVLWFVVQMPVHWRGFRVAPFGVGFAGGFRFLASGTHAR